MNIDVSPEALSALRLIPAVEEALEEADLVRASSIARGTTLPAFVLRRHSRAGRLRALVGKPAPAYPRLLSTGREIGPFTTLESDTDHYWLGESSTGLRTRYSAVVADIGPDGEPVFHCADIQHFHHWAMPLYHLAVRPVRRMAGQLLARRNTP